MFVVSTQNKKAKFVIHTDLQSRPQMILQKPLPPPMIAPNAPKPLFIPKIKKFKFKLSLVKEPHQSSSRTKKVKDNYQVFQKGKFRKNNSANIKFACGRWKEDEHKRFIEAIIKYGNDWKQVQKHVRTRSSTQARSHAQKFFVKIKKAKLLNFNLDLTKTSIKMFHDMIQESTPEEYEKILSALTSVAFERNSSKKRKKDHLNHNSSNSTNILSNNNSAFKNGSPFINPQKQTSCFNVMPIDPSINESNIGIDNDIDILNQHKEKEIKYIFNALINHISNEDLYGYDQYLSQNNGNTSEVNNNNEFIRRKRSSINSISGFFKAYIDDNEIKNLKMNNEGNNNNYSYTNKINTIGSVGNYFGYDEGNKMFSGFSSRKISQDDDYLFGYMKTNNGVNVANNPSINK